MVLGGLMSVWGSKFIGYPSAGALGCITIAFVAGIGWRRRAAKVLVAFGGGGQAHSGASTEYVSSSKERKKESGEAGWWKSNLHF